jgi:dTDP-4-amino-4,6-dideoxygalactose transaminase
MLKKLRRDGIMANLHYASVPRLQYYRLLGKRAFLDCPLAEKYAASALSLPIFPGMSSKNQYYILKKAKRHLLSNSRH